MKCCIFAFSAMDCAFSAICQLILAFCKVSLHLRHFRDFHIIHRLKTVKQIDTSRQAIAVVELSHHAVSVRLKIRFILFLFYK